MIEHQVWIKFNEDVTEETKQKHLQGLRSLIDKVPGVTAIKAGENFTDRAKGFTHGLSVTLESKEALATYATHPEHVAVAGPLKEDAELMALDFEF